MVSKNNHREYMRKLASHDNHYSIRKLSIGAASVLIGLTFAGLNNQQTQAAGTDDQSTQPQVSAVEAAQAEPVGGGTY